MRFRLYVLDENINNEKIVLSSDEIKICDIKYLPKEPGDNAKTLSRKEVQITGKIIGEIQQDQLEKIDFVKNLGNIQEAWKEKNNEISIKTSKLISDKFNGIKVINLEDILKNNRENLKGLRNWCNSFNMNDHRNIMIERIVENISPDIFYFENMFIHSFEEKGSIDEGNGEFTIIFKQKINSENKDTIEN
ncbi:hypothetical protein H3N56_11550 [Cetobacterium sp. 2A]|uniref:hypothetical protein n=1 Tax=Cetobacterium sp. 2A TaxID=2754723 RepID=UPI00163C5D2F|nr:hypothetical protein [Cetobacterium sp. 2A]MBC2857067.1 hypothetical protein [Cetobacterium sp. 2A]